MGDTRAGHLADMTVESMVDWKAVLMAVQWVDLMVDMTVDMMAE